MRRVPPSVAISVAFHLVIAGVAVVIGRASSTAELPEAATVPTIEVLPPTFDVVMLDQTALARIPELAPETPSPTRSPAVATRPRIARATATTGHHEEESLEPRPISPLLDMRKGQDPRGLGRDPLGLSRSVLGLPDLDPEQPRSVVETTNQGAIVDPKAPKESIVTAEVTPGGRGTYKVDDLVFKGRIAPDGTVSIKDKRNLQHQFTSWSNVKKVLREAGPLGLLKVDFDITDAMMRRHKMDPYASRKLAFLDQSRDARVELGKAHRKEQLSRTAELVLANLEVMWAAVTDLPGRKQALFELWDDAVESGDETAIAAGEAARLTVIGFIRARVPAGSPGAFTDAELAAFNRRRHSKVAFIPYE